MGCNVLGGNPVFGALSIASVLMVSIYALGSVSGANFNPAVSLALFLNDSASFSATKMASYMLIQERAASLLG